MLRLEAVFLFVLEVDNLDLSPFGLSGLGACSCHLEAVVDLRSLPRRLTGSGAQKRWLRIAYPTFLITARYEVSSLLWQLGSRRAGLKKCILKALLKGTHNVDD